MQSEPLADNLASTSALETEPGRDITVTSSRAVQASRSPELEPTEVLGQEDVGLSSKPPQPLDIPPTQEDVTIDRRGNSRPRSVKELADVFDRRQRHFAGIRQDNSFKRMEINYRLNNLEAESQRLQDCLEDIRSINAISKSGKTIKRPKARLKRLQEEMALDIQAFTRSCQELQSLSTDLRDHERKLEASEGAFDNVCQAVIRKLRVLGHEFINDSADDLSLKSTSYFQSSSSAATASPPVEELATYFAAFSRLRNMSERLDDLLTEQHDQQEQRDLWADREIMSDESEEAFLRRWENSIAPARNDYEVAYVALDNARRACDDANIQIPEWAKTDLNTEAEAEATTEVITNYGLSSNTTLVPVVRSLSGALENISVASSEQVAQVQALPGSSLPSGHLATTDRVVDWMEDIDSLNPDSFENAVVSPLPKSSGALKVPEIGHQHGRSTSLIKSRSDGELQGGRKTGFTHQRHASSGDVGQKVRGRDNISAPYTPLEYCSHEYDQHDETLLKLRDSHLYTDRLHPWSYY